MSAELYSLYPNDNLILRKQLSSSIESIWIENSRNGDSGSKDRKSSDRNRQFFKRSTLQQFCNSFDLLIRSLDFRSFDHFPNLKATNLQNVPVLERKSDILARKQIVVFRIVVEHCANKKLKKKIVEMIKSCLNFVIFVQSYFKCVWGQILKLRA